MDEGIGGVLVESLFVVYIVFGLMVATEYLNRVTTGRLTRWLGRSRLRQYVVAALLGATPGCAGAFAVVSLYMHGMVSAGAVVACMVATSGDEAFVMIARWADKALLLFGILFLYGIIAGFVGDALLRKRLKACCVQPHGGEEDICECVAFGAVRRDVGWERFVLGGVALAMAAFSVWRIMQAEGHLIAPAVMLGVSLFLAFASVSASRDYIRHHIVRHILGHHIWKVALWTVGAMLAAHLIQRAALEHWIKAHQAHMMWLAALVGIIPESGPHLVFVTLYPKTVPFSVLACSSVVQDGHGMLPLFSHSLRAALLVKAINLALGLALGYLLLYVVGC